MIALLLQADPLVTDPSIWRMIVTGSWVSKAVLLILLVFSIVSWAIILKKLIAFRRLRGKRRQFFHAFERRTNLADAYQAAITMSNNPLTEVFKAGTRELKLLSYQPAEESYGGNPVAAPARTAGIGTLEKESIHMALEREAARQVETLEEGLQFLATTGSVAPFFGLLGTVWGVMDAFLNIGLRGSGNVSVVAPGIAEALVATVAGLAVAIPAVIFYNQFVSEIKAIADDLAHFSSELINVIIREARPR